LFVCPSVSPGIISIHLLQAGSIRHRESGFERLISLLLDEIKDDCKVIQIVILRFQNVMEMNKSS
jgi:hypothetical protein